MSLLLALACSGDPVDLPEDEFECPPGKVFFVPTGSQARSDRSGVFGGAMDLDEPGAWLLCEGEWEVTLELDRSNNITIEGQGADRTVLRGEGGTVFQARDSKGIGLSELSLVGGQGGWVGERTVAGGLDLERAEVALSGVELLGHQGVRGGAIAAIDSSLSLHQVLLEGNLAEESGAGLHAGSSLLELDQVRLRDNEGGYGVGVMAQNSHVVASGLSFEAHHSIGFGAGLMLHEGTAEIQGLEVVGNESENIGAGVVVYGAELTLADATVSANTSPSGGAGLVFFYMGLGSVQATDVDFSDNSPFDLGWEGTETADLGDQRDLVCGEDGCR